MSGVFGTSADDTSRQVYVGGAIADALQERWQDLLSRPPEVTLVDLLAVK